MFVERGVGRRMKIRALKELMWKASRKWASSVEMTLRVKIFLKGSFSGVESTFVRGALVLLGRVVGVRGQVISRLVDVSCVDDSGSSCVYLYRSLFEKNAAIFLPSLLPKSSGLLRKARCVSSSPRMTDNADPVMKTALTRLGRAYGKFFSQPTPSFPPSRELSPNTPGKLLTGSAKKPPRIGPMITLVSR